MKLLLNCYRFKIINKETPSQQDGFYTSNQYKPKPDIKENVVLDVKSASTLDIKTILGKYHLPKYNMQNLTVKRISYKIHNFETFPPYSL